MIQLNYSVFSVNSEPRMFKPMLEKLTTFEKNLDKNDPRFSYLLVLRQMMSYQPMSKQRLEVLIHLIEQTKFTKTYPTFFDSSFTLRTLLAQERQVTQFLNKPFSQHEEMSERPLNPHQTRTLPQGVLNNAFTEFLMDIHQDLMKIYQLWPTSQSLSREQINHSQYLNDLHRNLQQENLKEAALDLGRGITLQDHVLPENASLEDRQRLLLQFGKGAEKAVSAVYQHVYADIGACCSEFFEDEDQADFNFYSAVGSIAWKKQGNTLYADIHCDFAGIQKNGMIYLLDSTTKKLREASEQELGQLRGAIRERKPLPFDPVWSCQGRLDLAADSQGVLRPFLASLTITMNCIDLKAKQQTLLYSPRALHHSKALKDWELHAGSGARIVDALHRELENTLSFEGNPIKFAYGVEMEEEQDLGHPKIAFYAFQDIKNQFYVLNSDGQFIRITREAMGELTQNAYANIKPFCIAEAHISENKIRALECTFNTGELPSNVKMEATQRLKMQEPTIALKL